MKTDTVSAPLSQKLRVPADIVYITLPLMCWALLAFRWCGLWLTEPWMVGVIVIYYALAVAYLVFAFIVRMRVIDIIGLFLLLAASFFVWIPYHWVLAVLLVPALFMAFYKRRRKAAATILTMLVGGIMLIGFAFAGLFRFLILKPERLAYHTSPDGRYAALQYSFTVMPGGTEVLLCRVYGPLLVQERRLYLANYPYGNIEWLDESTILIYGDTMNVFEDPEIKNYDPF